MPGSEFSEAEQDVLTQGNYPEGVQLRLQQLAAKLEGSANDYNEALEAYRTAVQRLLAVDRHLEDHRMKLQTYVGMLIEALIELPADSAQHRECLLRWGDELHGYIPTPASLPSISFGNQFYFEGVAGLPVAPNDAEVARRSEGDLPPGERDMRVRQEQGSVVYTGHLGGPAYTPDLTLTPQGFSTSDPILTRPARALIDEVLPTQRGQFQIPSAAQLGLPKCVEDDCDHPAMLMGDLTRCRLHQPEPSESNEEVERRILREQRSGRSFRTGAGQAQEPDLTYGMCSDLVRIAVGVEGTTPIEQFTPLLEADPHLTRVNKLRSIAGLAPLTDL